MWSWSSLILYLSMSFIGCWLIKKQEKHKKNYLFYIVFFIIWLLWAVGRYVGFYNGKLTGGSDAPTYISYFDVCLTDNTHLYSIHAEPLFRLLTKVIRCFTSDYHIYFAVLYGIILFSFLWFINEFKVEKACCLPILMLGFEYIKAFSIIRTMLSIAFILMGIVFLKKRKNILCILFMGISVFLQRASIVYACFPVFYYIYQKRLLTKGRAFRFVLLSSMVGLLGQKILASGSWSFFKGGAYDKYILMSSSTGYWANYIKIIIDQVFVLILMIIFLKKINKWSINKDKESQKRIRYLKYMCFYDILMVPVCAILNIWRGIDFFYMARLLMLGVLITTVKTSIKDESKRVYDILVLIGMVLWFVLRMITLYDKSDIMPYIFDFKGFLGI